MAEQTRMETFKVEGGQLMAMHIPPGKFPQ